MDDWRWLVRALKHEGLLEESQDGYPVLMLNAASWTVLRGERCVELAAPPKTERAPKRGERRKAKDEVVELPADEALFQQLRALRKRLADEHGVPPYVVFADAALRAMSREQPTTLTAFAEIPGVGEAKLKRYGEVFVAAIAAATAG